MGKRIYLLLVVLLWGAALLAQEKVNWTLPPYEIYQFENGLQLIVVENHTNPLVSTVVVIRAGLRNETPENNGVSHMLEHMTFNGTERRTQKQLYDELDYYGIYLNAQTSDDYTSFISLNDVDHFEKSLDILSDMLFHSTFPETNFEKEKGIIVEEVGKDADNPDYQKELAFRKALYAGTPYEMPVIGTVESIRRMTRQQVQEYYQTYYRPNNMIAMVFGDVQPEEVRHLFEKYFGNQKAAPIPRRSIHLKQEYPFVFTAPQSDGQLHYWVIPAPTFQNRNFLAFQLLYQYAFSSTETSFMSALLKRESLNLKQVSASFTYHPEFAHLVFKLRTGQPLETAVLKRELTQQFQQLTQTPLQEDDIHLIKRDLAISDILQMEKIQYYGFLKSQDLAVGGLAAFERLLPGILQLPVGEVQKFVQSYSRYWNNPAPIFEAMPWAREIDIQSYQPARPLDKTKSAREVTRFVLPNGLTVVYLRNSDNPVLAIHLLFKNRAAWEPPGKTGLVDFLHHTLFKSSHNYPSEKMQKALKSIGAEVKAYDWGFIPYDDYYNVPEYSYIRFVTLDQFANQALEILADNLKHLVVSEEDFQTVKKQMMGLVNMQQGKASEQARWGFYRLLYGEDHPLAQPVSGTPQTISSITREELLDFASRYFTGKNIILSVVSGLETERLKELIENNLSDLPDGDDIPEIPDIPLTEGVQKDSLILDKQQASLYWGYNFAFEKSHQAALTLANSMLSDQLAFNLREIKGWAYVMRSSLDFWRGRGTLNVYMGTSPQNLKNAIAGIMSEMEAFRNREITEDDLERTRNKLVAGIIRRRASRENQAYFLGLNEFLGQPPDAYFARLKMYKDVSLEQIQQVQQAYFGTDNYCLYFVK